MSAKGGRKGYVIAALPHVVTLVESSIVQYCQYKRLEQENTLCIRM